MSTYQPIFTHKIYLKIYDRTISRLYNMGENIVVVLNIYGARVFKLFCDHQDTEYE